MILGLKTCRVANGQKFMLITPDERKARAMAFAAI